MAISIETPEVTVDAKEVLVNERVYIGRWAMEKFAKEMKQKYGYGVLCDLAKNSEIVILLREKK